MAHKLHKTDLHLTVYEVGELDPDPPHDPLVARKVIGTDECNCSDGTKQSNHRRIVMPDVATITWALARADEHVAAH